MDYQRSYGIPPGHRYDGDGANEFAGERSKSMSPLNANINRRPVPLSTQTSTPDVPSQRMPHSQPRYPTQGSSHATSNPESSTRNTNYRAMAGPSQLRAPAQGNNMNGRDVYRTETSIHDPRMQPYRDIDTLYGNQAFAMHQYDDDEEDRPMASTEHQSHRQHDSPHPQTPMAPAASERTRAAPNNYLNDTRSNAAAVPLMSEYASSPPAVPPHNQPRNFARSVSAQTHGYSANLEPGHNSIPPPNRLSRGISMYGDDYDGGIWNPNDIVEDEDEALYQPKRASKYGKMPSIQSLGVRATSLGGVFNSRDRLNGAGAAERPGLVASESNNTIAGKNVNMESQLSLQSGQALEKSEWLQEQRGGRKRMRWIIGIIVTILVVAAIVGGIVGGVLGSRKSSSQSSGPRPASSGLYTIDSSDVKALLNNKNLHRVFPGMDYTPLNAQYPECLTNPPDQNNVTLDVAMLAQLTPAIRLYGTDCAQTEMLLKAIDLLGYNETVKVWLGVWLGRNQTTNTRQLDQMYTILDDYPADHFAGIIIGNEVLFREDLTIDELGTVLSSVRSNLTAKNIDLPVATSDLGDDWTAGLAADTDIVMANIHPFFAGVTPDVASGWSWNFWQTHNVILTGASTPGSKYPKHIVSEIGWPSEGGNNCGTSAGCPDDTSGAVASIENMNTFMEGWVCPSLENGTTYFWFEAFNEPWKAIFNTDKDQWETRWGLMDENRNLKKGLKIPDCGRTVDKPY